MSYPDLKDELALKIRKSYIPIERPTGSLEREFIFRLKNGAVYYIGNRSSRSIINYQNSIVKVSYIKNTEVNNWSAHGRYLQREGAQVEGKVGLGFDREKDNVDIGEILERWQEAGDPHVFKLIISPEQAQRLDLKKHVRLVMERLESDYGAKIEWAGIDHYNTDNAHAHVVLRGKDMNGKEIRISKDYIKNGFRQRSKEAATRQIGPRLVKDMLKRRELAIRKNYITELDRDIGRMKDANNMITFTNSLPKNKIETERRLHIIGRLQYLEKLGFAEKTGVITWKVSDDMMRGLKAIQVAGDIIKRKANYQSSITESGLPVARTFLKEGEHITGRIVGSGLHDENLGKRYVLIEGLDGKVHYVHPTKAMIRARDSWEVRNNDVVHLEVKSYFKEGKKKTYLNFTNWGSLEKIKWNKGVTAADRYFIRHFIFDKRKIEISQDIRTFRRKFFNVMNERFTRLKTLGYIDRNHRIKRYKIIRE